LNAETILEQAADAVIFADRDGTIRVWNAAASALLGFAKEEALGANLDLIIPEHLRKAHWAGFDRAMASGTTRLGGQATLTRALHKDGRRLYVEMSFAVARTGGEVIGAIAIARDATARQEARGRG
jgi:PAS domain S-box-containing protein